jgi:hypothetical protein
MHKVLKLAVMVLVGAVAGAGVTCAPANSAEQTVLPISYTSAWPDPGMQSIAPRAAAAPSSSGLRMAQSDCGCNMLYQQGAGQCQAFGFDQNQYRYCMAVVQQNVNQCMLEHVPAE